MNNKLSQHLFALYMVMAAGISYGQAPDVKKEFGFAEQQTARMLRQISEIQGDDKLASPRTFENGRFKMVSSSDWTSGFFAGELWFLYQETKDEKWLKAARLFTEKLSQEQFNKGTHDLGFMIYCSYGNGYKAKPNETYRAVIINAARSLSTRFNAKTGVIKSWDHKAQWQNPVIIDNMMNLELLFEAFKLTRDSSFYKVAVSHADRTMQNHFRSDFSSYHVVDYDPVSGKVLSKMTHQGYNDESAWARGQAWALYGFATCYRETNDKRYLVQAQRIAKFIFTNPAMPVDLIPYWDYNDPAIPNTSKDVSAACITASALYELSRYNKANNYTNTADKIMASLSHHYKSFLGENGDFILLHSTGNRPANSEIDVPLNYADYYYLEALLRSRTARHK